MQSLICYPETIGTPIVHISNCFFFLHINTCITLKLKLNDKQYKLKHLGTLYYCYIRYISVNTSLSAILASYEVNWM